MSTKPQGESSWCQHKAESGFSGEGTWSGDPTGHQAVLGEQKCVPALLSIVHAGDGKKQEESTLTLHSMSVQDCSQWLPPRNTRILKFYPIRPPPPDPLPPAASCQRPGYFMWMKNVPGCALSPTEFISCQSNQVNSNFVMIYCRKGN